MKTQAVTLFLLCATTGLFAAEGEAEAPVTLDPVVASVVQMLEEQVSPESISEWLDQADTAPGTLKAGDLIALERAGAPDDLVKKLLRLAAAAKSPASPEVQRHTAQPSPEHPEHPRKLLPLAPPPPTPMVPLSPGSVNSSATQQPPAVIPVAFDIRYAPQVIEYQTTAWDLFVYADGRPLASFDGWAAHTAKHMDRKAFSEWLEAGPHVIRVLQEQHERKSKRRDRWSHKARIFDQPIVVDLNESGDWEVQIQVVEANTSFGSGKSEYAVLHDGQTIEEGEGPGPGPRRWPALCDEVEADLPPKKLHASARGDAMGNCLRWASLWENVEPVPDRATVREQMAARDFELDPAAPR